MLSKENAYIVFAFCPCYMGVQICGNLNAENKMRDIGKKIRDLPSSRE